MKAQLVIIHGASSDERVFVTGGNYARSEGKFLIAALTEEWESQTSALT